MACTDNQTQSLGDVFVTEAVFLKDYKPYLLNYGTVFIYLRHCRLKYPAFEQLFTDFEKKFNNSVQSFLVMPVQRFPRYIMLLKALVTYTSPDNPGYDTLVKVTTKLETDLSQINSLINPELIRQLKKVVSVTDLIENFSFEDMDLERRLLFEGKLTAKLAETEKKSTKKQQYAYLFSDVIVVCHVAKNAEIFPFSLFITIYISQITEFSPCVNSKNKFCSTFSLGDGRQIILKSPHQEFFDHVKHAKEAKGLPFTE